MYRIEDINTIERIAVLQLREGNGSQALPSATVDEHLADREAYREGWLTEAPDLSIHQDDPDIPPEDPNIPLEDTDTPQEEDTATPPSTPSP